MFYSVYKLDRTLLANVRTMYSTCHKLNKNFVSVRVFQVIGIYLRVFQGIASRLGVSEFYHCSQTHV